MPQPVPWKISSFMPTDPFEGVKVDGYRGDTNPYDLNDGEWSYVRNYQN